MVRRVQALDDLHHAHNSNATILKRQSKIITQCVESGRKNSDEIQEVDVEKYLKEFIELSWELY